MKVLKLLLGLMILPIVFGFSNIAHRGDNEEGKYVEHSYQAYDRAAAGGADYLELDIHQTKDGVLVVSHDDNLSRVFGVDKVITLTDYKDLKNYRNRANEPLHTLEEVFERYRSVPKLKFMIETKNKTKKIGMEPELVDLIQKYHFTDRVLIESFSIQSLKQVKKLDPQIKTCLLGNQYTQVGENDYYANGNYSEKIANYLKDHHKKYLVWGVDTKNQMNYFINNKMVEGVLTNYPIKLARIKREKRQLWLPINGNIYLATKNARPQKFMKRGRQHPIQKHLKVNHPYKLFKIAFRNHNLWYELGKNQWVKAEDISFYPPSCQSKSAPQLKIGMLQVISKRVKVYNSPKGKGHKNSNLKRNTKWQYFAIMTYKKQEYYNLGGNQWIDSKDVKVIR
ncbi:glycerophosphodiester phosphodiesterase [Lactobacillus sp. PV034]|uniref:glycerophosphodiester phosphodiesterase n=1 Tax=Lactobacillus sp. PV034 TaxID=2594495 RepID=UPI00223FDFA9|nr:glycerophosphodiester phosphodiesterase family protein [Lactobacillus sp. PV034]QNQ81006.1 glycerophosphodiester phosphodiesterase [Lactobacillus sp. PV034]